MFRPSFLVLHTVSHSIVTCSTTTTVYPSPPRRRCLVAGLTIDTMSRRRWSPYPPDGSSKGPLPTRIHPHTPTHTSATTCLRAVRHDESYLQPALGLPTPLVVCPYPVSDPHPASAITCQATDITVLGSQGGWGETSAKQGSGAPLVALWKGKSNLR